jgi:hypothetical protein
MNFTLLPIYWVAGAGDDECFDVTRLPLEVTEGTRIEAVAGRFRNGTFDLFRARLGTDKVADLEGVRYALVHRYEPGYDEGAQREHSASTVRMLAACLRLIRPMREKNMLIHGSIRNQDESFDVMGFNLGDAYDVQVPEVQMLFSLRNRDADDLRRYAPEFLRGMRGQYWKFRMAVQFHQLGHFQPSDWKARFLLWCSAIESIYTSHDRDHQGSLVATSRIKWFISEDVSIYGPGDISSLLEDPHITVRQVVDDLYEMRNYVAHGDRIPDPYFTDILRRGFIGAVNKWQVLLEASSFIVRTSLMKILRDGLLDHFVDAGSAERYFGSAGLTKRALKAAQRAAASRASHVGP